MPRARERARAPIAEEDAEADATHWARAIRASVRRDGGANGASFAAHHGAGGGGASFAAKRAAVRAMETLFARLTSAAATSATVRDALPLDGEDFVVDGLDAEQVWTQLDAQTAPVLRACKREAKVLGKLGAGGDVDVGALFDVVVDRDRGAASASASEEEEEEEEEEDDDDDDDGSDGSDGSEQVKSRTKSGKKSSSSDRTSKFFKNPGMFSLDDMENFLDDAEEEEGRRRGTAGGSDDDEEDDGDAADSDDQDSDEENDIYRDLSESDEDEDEDEDLDDALAYTAKLAGVSASARSKKAKKAKGKKAQDLMFDDFFGKHKGKPLGGTKGGKLGAANDMELNELSDEEEDMFNELEGDDDADDDEEQDDSEDDVQGEIETGIAGNRGLERHDDDEDEYAEEDEDDEDDEELAFGGEDDEELDELDRKLEADLDAELARAQEEEGMSDSGDEDEDDEDDVRGRASRDDGRKSAFQIQQEKLARQIDKLEASAIGDKTWVLKGEANAKERPLNSALETDLEFEHVMAPAPVISEEITQKLEDIIKQRIIEGRFDDVERVEPVEERERREAPQLDDTKSTKGLGDIYADEYMKQKVGVALGEKEDPLVAEAQKLWALLSYRLDQLCQVHKVEEPKDIEERIARQLQSRAAGDQVPMSFNEEQRQAPEEIFAGGDGKGGVRGSAAGALKADEELTKEERKAGRAKRKRKSKAVREEKERVKSKRDREREAQNKAAEDAGFTRKAPKVSMLAAAPAGGRSKSEFSKSSKVFGMLQDAKDADAARGGPAAKKSKSDGTTNRSSLKL